MISSYEPNARVPKVGTRWVWEIDLPHARELIEVIEVIWNGEEWWVRTKSLLPNLTWPRDKDEFLNDLSRFWEAATPVGGTGRGISQSHQVREGVSYSVSAAPERQEAQ